MIRGREERGWLMMREREGRIDPESETNYQRGLIGCDMAGKDFNGITRDLTRSIAGCPSLLPTPVSSFRVICPILGPMGHC